ncbi:MjaI family restriction endonuclease, partial [bacterium]|nr:MjaI family restriction endonuclease [Candidatus Elulimicrobium humile]
TNLNTEEKLIDSGKKLFSMLQKFKDAINSLDEEDCIEYVKEVTYNKSVMGFSYEEIAIETVANYFNLPYRYSTEEEESQGIDGYVGEKPVQVKKSGSAKKNHVRNHANEFKTLVILYDEENKTCEIVNPEFMSMPN